MGSLIDKAHDKEREKREKEEQKAKKAVIDRINEEMQTMSYEDVVYFRRMLANQKNIKNFFITMHHLSRNLG